ncbi:MAG: chloride channel protein [Clostridia bacterium]|nr:chloride channel protein [Clostridia bacterium]
MLKRFFRKWRLRSTYASTIVRWIAFAVAMGLLCGVIGTAFDLTLEAASHQFAHHPWLILLLPVAGVVIVWLYKIGRVKKDNGSDMIVHSVREDLKVPYAAAPLVFIGTALTQLCGGSSGREGAALQMGGAVGTFCGRMLRLKEKNTNILAMCGMAALFSAVFGTPVTASVFAIEMISVGAVYYMAFFPCLLSSIIAYLIAIACGVVPAAQKMAKVILPDLSLLTLGRVLLMGAVFALLSVLFVSAVHKVEHLAAHHLENPYLRVVVGGSIVSLLTVAVWWFTDGFAYNGAGMEGVIAAVAGEADPWDCLLKIAFTAFTLGCGFKGGKIVPGFFIGATFGCVMAGWMGLPSSFGAALGLVALFSGMTNCPLASLILGIELFGGAGVLYYTIMAAMLYMLAGYYSFYSGREAAYSKLQEEYIHHSRVGTGRRIK